MTQKPQYSGSDRLNRAVEQISRAGISKVNTAIHILSDIDFLNIPSEKLLSVNLQDIPGAPRDSHDKRSQTLSLVKHSGHTVLIIRGGYFAYRGASSEDTAWPVALASRLGVKRLLLTAPASGLHEKTAIGKPMLITDHINYTGASIPFKVPPPGYVDLWGCYDEELSRITEEILIENRIPFSQGVLAGLPGPALPTPAEARALSSFADASAFTMVQEAIAAKLLGIRTSALVWIVHRPVYEYIRPQGTENILPLVRMLRKTGGDFYNSLLERILND